VVLNVALRSGVVRCVFLAYLFCGAAMAQTTVPGKIPGEFAVSPSGAATYRIPIEVPPGVAGMQPQLALSYNSQAGNGIMGMGWSIEGLSAITRCPKTPATDGVRGSVNFNTEDRFCLDGQRLINVAGAYGAAGSEYRTELESFSRITAHGAAAGSAANGPERFTVQTKAGLTLEYGATADSRIEAQGRSVVRVWALNRTIDVKGNAIDYGYTEDNANGQYLIDTVSYAGNQVKFAYEDRPDRFVGYQLGTRVSQTRRLQHVSTLVAGEVMRRWTVEYSQNATPIDKSKAQTLSTCFVRQQRCLPPLAFLYPSSILTEFSKTEFVAGDSMFLSTQAVDINGDGRADVAMWHANGSNLTFVTKLGDGSGRFSSVPLVLPYLAIGTEGRGHFVDIDGDGKLDFLHTSFHSTYVRPFGTTPDAGYDAIQLRVVVRKGDGQGGYGAAVVQSATHDTTDLHEISPVDLNGDGKVDLLQLVQGASGLIARAWMGDGSGRFSVVETQLEGKVNVPFEGEPNRLVNMAFGKSVLMGSPVQMHDINGDGVLDVIYRHKAASGQQQTRARLGDGTGRFGTLISIPISSTSSFLDILLLGSTKFEPTDLNGDGVADFIEFVHDVHRGPVIKARIGDGTGNFGLVETLNGVTPHSANRQVFDFNGDGFADIVYWYFDDARGLMLHLKLGDGAGGFGHQEIVLQDGKGGPAHNVEFADIDGNGIPDILYWFYDEARGLVLRSKVNTFNDGGRLREMVQSGQSIVSLEYKTLSSPANLHNKDSTTAYPRVDLQPAIQVVSAVSQPNGLGGWNKTTYSYGGLKAEHASGQYAGSGRGMLGFRWMKSLEEATGIETFTEFSQGWPTIGQVIKSETRLAGAGNAGLLKQTTSSYGCHQTAGVVGSVAPGSATTACGPWSPGKIYFPHLIAAVEDSWDLDGTTMPRLSTTQTYAGSADQAGGVRQFGDPTQIRVDIHQGGALQHRKDTTNEYHPARTTAGQWQLGRLKKASVSSTQH
jgi:hypothetical protein